MESLFRKAAGLQQAGRLDEAEALYRQILDWRPEWTAGNLGVILRITGRLEEAEMVLRGALATASESLALNHTLGLTLLQLGQYPEGWRRYEARHQFRFRVTAPYPEWRGEPLKGKRLLVLAEQGLGDQILWSRFIPLLAAQAAEVRLAVARPLVRLFEGQLPAEVFNAQGFEGLPVDLWTSMGSAARWLEAGPADAPAPTLRAAAAIGPPTGIGLMLQGGLRNPNNARIPPPAVADAIRGLAPHVDLDPEVSGARDLADTAQIIAGLERVVTVDTSVAHLAGALGKPVHILLPRPAWDWYANWKDDCTPWYPSARTLRQRTPGDWAGVISDLAVALSRPPPTSEPR